jgi:pyrroloquinoline quinone biosynthesis protein B
MQVKILGSAAGGGFPQWNCACRNCHLARMGKFPGKTRTQAQVAISIDQKSWFLLGASPDLRLQLEKTPELWPRQGTRSSPIHGVILASAELDQVTGLLHLRELQPFQVYATASVTSILREQNTMFRMLNRVPRQVSWQSFQGGEEFSLKSPEGEEAGIRCRAVSISNRYPSYVGHNGKLVPNDATVGLILTSKSGRAMGYFPTVSTVTKELLQQFEQLDLLLFDGTFWSEDELIQIQGFGQRAREMGHIPVGGETGSLEQLRALQTKRKLYIHINNTNSMLDESGAQYRAVRDAGWEIAEDGWQDTL